MYLELCNMGLIEILRMPFYPLIAIAFIAGCGFESFLNIPNYIRTYGEKQNLIKTSPEYVSIKTYDLIHNTHMCDEIGSRNLKGDIFTLHNDKLVKAPLRINVNDATIAYVVENDDTSFSVVETDVDKYKIKNNIE